MVKIPKVDLAFLEVEGGKVVVWAPVLCLQKGFGWLWYE